MAEGIGARLRSARERSRLTILQAAEKLHVDADILEALEAENFAALGAPVYVKGHLRHYAELVGESPEALFDLYSQGARPAQPDLTRIPRAQPDDTRGLVMPAAIVLIGFALAGTVWWVSSLSHRPLHTTGERPVPVTVGPAAPVPQEQTMPVALSGEVTSPGRAEAPAASASASPSAPVALPSRSVAVSAARPIIVPAGQIDVVLTYNADSWTEVYDATGRKLLYGLSNGPATRRVEGVPPLSVMLGNASEVSVEVGGHTASISRFVRSDHTARFLIAADGRALAAAPRKKGG
jgi:cytoskeleton protein RodZ